MDLNIWDTTTNAETQMENLEFGAILDGQAEDGTTAMLNNAQNVTQVRHNVVKLYLTSKKDKIIKIKIHPMFTDFAAIMFIRDNLLYAENQNLI